MFKGNLGHDQNLKIIEDLFNCAAMLGPELMLQFSVRKKFHCLEDFFS